MRPTCCGHGSETRSFMNNVEPKPKSNPKKRGEMDVWNYTERQKEDHMDERTYRAHDIVQTVKQVALHRTRRCKTMGPMVKTNSGVAATHPWQCAATHDHSTGLPRYGHSLGAAPADLKQINSQPTSAG